MTKHRESLQIIADILSIVQNGVKKTHIMYQANLSYSLLCRYLDKVLEAGLVRKDLTKYWITKKGQSFLTRYSNYEKSSKEMNYRIRLLEETKEALEQY